jgi:hypothetical protein
MSAKATFPYALLLTVLSLGPAWGGDPPVRLGGVEALDGAEPETIGAPQLATGNGPVYTGQVLPAEVPGVSGSLSSWIRYTRPDCCGPIGAHGPIHTELYALTGPSLPIGGGLFGTILDTGWDVQGGGRSLFYNSDVTAAWTADLSLQYIYNHGKPDKTINLFRPGTSVETMRTTRPTAAHMRALHRVNGTINLGREWYLKVPDNNWGLQWRVGLDGGGRLGTVRLDLVELPHRTDVLYGVDVAVHSDLEIPRGCCNFLIGVRAEWDHDWMSILQSQNNSNLQDANFLLTFGVRY